ncbi:MAG: DUF3021 domain-containing protein [Desulfobacterales bacterium]|nr:DUF3021 domain-containing protein [Desulfobacterales bacterium]
MLKKMGIRAAGGFAYGVLLGQIIAIIISLSFGDGKFYQVIPEFRALFENEITAVIVQVILTGIVGTVFATASIVFEFEKWSVLKQCLVHFFITAAFWIPIVYLCWMPQNVQGILIYLANFLGVYVINWLIQYFIAKNDVKKINAKIIALNDHDEI